MGEIRSLGRSSNPIQTYPDYHFFSLKLKACLYIILPMNRNWFSNSSPNCPI